MEVVEFESVKLFEEIIKAGQIKNLISVSSHKYPIYINSRRVTRSLLYMKSFLQNMV